MARHDFDQAAPVGVLDLADAPRDTGGAVSLLVSPAGLAWLDRIRGANRLDTWAEAAESVLAAVLSDPAGLAAIPHGLALLVPAAPTTYGRGRFAPVHSSRLFVRIPAAVRPALDAIARREGLSAPKAAAAILEDVRLDDQAEEFAPC